MGMIKDISFPMTEELFYAIALNVAKDDVMFESDRLLTDDELWYLIEGRKKSYILGLRKICVGDIIFTEYDAETQTVHLKTNLSDFVIKDLTIEQLPDKINILTAYRDYQILSILTINKKDGSYDTYDVYLD